MTCSANSSLQSFIITNWHQLCSVKYSWNIPREDQTAFMHEISSQITGIWIVTLYINNRVTETWISDDQNPFYSPSGHLCQIWKENCLWSLLSTVEKHNKTLRSYSLWDPTQVNSNYCPQAVSIAQDLATPCKLISTNVLEVGLLKYKWPCAGLWKGQIWML